MFVGAVLLGIGLGAPAISACAVFELFNKKYHGIAVGIGMSTFSLGQAIGVRSTQFILGDSFENISLCAVCLFVVGVIGVITSLLVKKQKEIASQPIDNKQSSRQQRACFVKHRFLALVGRGRG